MLNKVKKAMRLTVNAYDDELLSLIEAARADLNLVGVPATGDNDALITRAIITFCRTHFGTPSDYERLKSSYDEQKAQLQTASAYGLGDEE